MKRFLNFFAMQCVLSSRSRIALFWSFVYPVAMMLLMLSVFGNTHKPGPAGADPRLVTVTGVVVLTIMSGGIFALVTVLAADFQSGVYKRLKLTDLGPLHVIGALMLRQLLIVASGVILVLLGARLLFGVAPNGDIASLVFLTVVGTILFCSIGFIIANVCTRPPSATAIANMVFLVMLFLSGSTFPKTFFPPWLLDAVQILPASHLFDLVEAQLYYGEPLFDNTKSLAVLVGMCLVLLAAAIKTFKWK